MDMDIKETPYVPWYSYPVAQVHIPNQGLREYYVDPMHDEKLQARLLEKHPRHICSQDIEASLLDYDFRFINQVTITDRVIVYFECHRDETTCCYLKCCGYNPDTSFRMALTVTMLFVIGLLSAILLHVYRHFKKIYIEWQSAPVRPFVNWQTAVAVRTFGCFGRLRGNDNKKAKANKRNADRVKKRRYVEMLRRRRAQQPQDLSLHKKRPRLREAMKFLWRRLAIAQHRRGIGHHHSQQLIHANSMPIGFENIAMTSESANHLPYDSKGLSKIQSNGHQHTSRGRYSGSFSSPYDHLDINHNYTGVAPTRIVRSRMPSVPQIFICHSRLLFPRRSVSHNQVRATEAVQHQDALTTSPTRLPRQRRLSYLSALSLLRSADATRVPIEDNHRERGGSNASTIV